jgi:hypothetical protein
LQRLTPSSQSVTRVSYWVFRFKHQTKTIRSEDNRALAIPIRITGMPTIEATLPTTLYTLTTGCGYFITGSVVIKLPSNSMLDILIIVEALL